MTFENNHIQLPIENDIYKETLHRYIMKWITEIDNDKEALYITDNKREIYSAALLYNNNNTNNILYNQSHITQITIPTQPTQQQQPNKHTRKKTTYHNIAGDRTILNFSTGGNVW